ncbi:MAG: FMN-binding protein [Bacteroidales bacterium]|jgi:Na+-translocating ferredoxin:NAD+ oxidoreductase RnfG subunit
MTRLILIIAVLGSQAAIPEQPLWTAYHKQVDKELTNLSAAYDRSEYFKTADSREFYRIRNRSGEQTGILVLTSAQGRFERFDLMVVINPPGTIRFIRVLKYRSEFGSEITNKGWLSQFYTHPGKKFELHKNIDAISGATYSSRGLIDEINSLLITMRSNNPPHLVDRSLSRNFA